MQQSRLPSTVSCLPFTVYRLPPGEADLILANARVLNTARAPWHLRSLPSAVAIKGDKILAAGGREVVRDYSGAMTRVIDCQHGAILHGFNDAHCHIVAYAASLLHLDVSHRAVSSIEEIKSLVRSRTGKLLPGEWITGSGYDEFNLREKRHPLRLDLDEAAPDHPVRLIHRTGYACVLNSSALRLMNITVNTVEPEDGYIDRDQHGEPNGLLFGMKDYLEAKLEPELQKAGEIEKGLSLANKKFLGWGITSLQDATLSNDLKRWFFFEKIKNEGILTSRITFMPGYRNFAEFRSRGFKPGQSAGSPEKGSYQLRLGPVKIVVNMTRGKLYPEQEELDRLVLGIHRAGFQLALHSLEVETLESEMKALTTALREYPRKNHRHRIEHCSLCPTHMLGLLKDIEAIVVSQPAFLYYNGDRYLSFVPQEQKPWLYRLGSFHRAGIRVAFSSDSPVAEPDPLMGLYASVVRLTAHGDDILPLELVTLPEAMQMYTYNSAYASFEEKIKGSIEAGKLADLVLLKPNPLEVGLKSLKDVKVLLTIVGGKIVYEGS